MKNLVKIIKKDMGWRLFILFTITIFFFSGRKINDLNKKLQEKALLDICVRGLYNEYTANWRDSCNKMSIKEQQCTLDTDEGNKLRKYYLERIGDCLVKFPIE